LHSCIGHPSLYAFSIASGGEDGRARVGDNHINLQANEFGRDLGEALAASLRPAILDADSATFDPAKFAQPLDKGGNPLAHG
jgi:hypothetical protein